MTRFRFGENWSDFVRRLSPAQIAEAERSLRSLLGRDDLSSATFLDVGSGSGLSSLAASRLGAFVTSFDFDETSVQVTAAMRDHTARSDWRVLSGSILDRDFTASLGRFDIVYAWGVLHHTGAMWTAIENAAALVAPSGTFALALYRKTPLCGAWRAEKRLYAAAPPFVQAAIRAVYKSAFITGLIATGRNPLHYIRDYAKNRGMEWPADVHDWLGGYPYESAQAADVKTRLQQMGFTLIRSIERPPGIGLFGTGCDEFVARR